MPKSVYKISDAENLKVCVVMVGLPARGKSFISQKIVRFLSWISINARSFNVGQYRRDAGTLEPSSDFFDFANEENYKLRKQAESFAVEDILKWFNEEDGVVAVLDATNTTRERRDRILKICQDNNIAPMFLESYSDDQDFVLRNIKEVRTVSPDYKDLDPEEATKDFLKKIAEYEKTYETLSDKLDGDLTYMKLINGVQEVIVNKIQTYLQSRIAFYVMNLHIKPRCIYLSRHGESIYNVEQKIGGDSLLSPRGLKYSQKLPELVRESAGDVDLTVWTSTLKRTQQTAECLSYRKLQWKALDELDAGICDGMTYEEIENKYPEDFKARDEDKYEYRYRGGESYRDVVIRLEPVIMELERQENILIITHQAVLRCIYAYYMNVPQEESPWMSIPLHTLIKLEPRAYGTKVTRIKANIPAVSTYKEKGTSQVGESVTVGGGIRDIINETPEDK
ncbi:hypothetical protein Kpol_2001p19 [Vanderwaltozyma polyspora DSM 70294]|uniref:fructose-2,6-bisphosphate 2-phosphatase n=1 Tax=Vanderwaltozyma polyspora (strain ATCC 22028 / DSM 70294 / BCRC 21397 / CBS 2163 / NBRC 10782 / NRRL Y-8283 / UCD 57-17) TaxID=436907 RepID=A7TGQ5_VANPO|nr:uncharacterized protein Kpol_2001p19 [Vanderwaltozyma polyspora DSM 70294]EDO18518.1 hypothetical protein Kpol_2001p19 [Vanderwaltozyma polyspora DSM 70294]